MVDTAETFEDRVERLALKLLREGTAEHIESARAQARRQIEDSEERTFDPAVTDHEDPGVIRRTSSQTASDGSSGAGGVIRQTHDGD